ncbi:hypothetical protein APR04_003909 [Promicromonospora umidemergens]|uniref:hypothetical protein n=1 Tax=Promicromonospora umidemergens TaxID=629679 RepID=UPI0020A296F2|nr:hypothetical protein [Promicromonospora umidemergens]MCP2284982.1 hypothetical protein [Promicromonospora umidemergens]
MSVPVRRRAGSSAVQRVLVIVLLALTGVLGATAGESSAPTAATMTAELGAEPVAWLGGDSAVSAHDPAPGAGTHAHDTISLLCLCALVVAGVLLAAGRGAPLHRLHRRVPASAWPTWVMRDVAPFTSTNPLSWGVCRR